MANEANAVSADVNAYVDRLRALLSDTEPLRVLRTTVKTLNELLNRSSDKELMVRPAPEKWSIAEIVAHLCDSETATRFRFRQLLTQPDGAVIPAYDQDAWAIVSRNNEIPTEESFELFSALRRSNLRLWEALTPAQVAKFGQHQERGRESVRDLLILIAGHDLNHLNQIRAISSPDLRTGPKA